MTQGPNRSPASIKARLLTVSKSAGEEFQHTLERYAVERFLVRVVHSEYRDRFVLKGAALYTVWTGQPHRPTRDLDLLGQLTPDEATIAESMRQICGAAVEPDGLSFDADSIEASKIREDQRYGGIRVLMNAYLGKARIRVQVDVGFGDAVTPGPILVQLPSMLVDLPAATVSAYNLETVVAEKLEALISLGTTNSRMKDFYDIWVFSRRFEFEGSTLVQAVYNTFERRATSIPASTPVALTAEFAMTSSARSYWVGFLKAAGLAGSAPEFSVMAEDISSFAMPVLDAARTNSAPPKHWRPGGPWSEV